MKFALGLFASAGLAYAVKVNTEGEDGTCTSAGNCNDDDHFWATHKGNRNLTGFADFAVPRDIRQETVSWQWKDPENSVLRMTPIIDSQKNLYLATTNGRVIKFSPDGKELWTHRTEFSTIVTNPALQGGKIFYATADGFFVALNMDTGKKVWSTRLSDGISNRDTQSIFSFKGKLVLAVKIPNKGKVNNNAIVCVNAATGRTLWIHRMSIMDTFRFQAVTPGDDSIVIMDTGGRLFRICLNTGMQIWKSGFDTTDAHVYSQGGVVLGPDGILYSVSNSDPHRVPSIVHAHRIDGSLVWKQTFKYSGHNAPAVGRVAGTDGLSVVFADGAYMQWPAAVDFSSKYFYPEHGTPKFLQMAPFAFGLFFLFKLVRGKGIVSGVNAGVFGVILLFGLIFGAAVTVHYMDLSFGQEQWWPYRPNPHHPFFSELKVLNTKDGSTRWSYRFPELRHRAIKGDSENLMSRWFATEAMMKPGLPLCAPETMVSQPIITKDGTVFAGYADGKLYSIRDDNGDGKIDAGEVKTVDLGHGFAATQAMAPGLFAAVPCGGGMWVWRS